MARPKIGLVLGSGAARGISHIGILRIIEKLHIPIDIIVGTSMGAIIGGAYAAGNSLKKIEDSFCDINWLKILKMIAPSRLQWEGLFDGDNIKDFIKARIGEHRIEKLNTKFACVATDIWKGDEIVLEKGSLIDALRASMSIPLFFSPVKIGGRYLVDGGVVNPVPVDVARKLGADIVIAVVVTRNINQFTTQMSKESINTHYTPVPGSKFDNMSNDLAFNTDLTDIKSKLDVKSEKEDSLSITQHMNRVSIIMGNTLLNMRLAAAPPDILIRPNTDKYKLTDFTKAEEFIELGEEAARLSLSNEIMARLIKEYKRKSFYKKIIPKFLNRCQN